LGLTEMFRVGIVALPRVVRTSDYPVHTESAVYERV